MVAARKKVFFALEGVACCVGNGPHPPRHQKLPRAERLAVSVLCSTCDWLVILGDVSNQNGSCFAVSFYDLEASDLEVRFVACKANRFSEGEMTRSFGSDEWHKGKARLWLQ